MLSNNISSFVYNFRFLYYNIINLQTLGEKKSVNYVKNMRDEERKFSSFFIVVNVNDSLNLF